MNVTRLWIYPIKSCRGIEVDRLDLDDRGPRNDRRWMLVDRDMQFLTQREFPRMVLIDVEVVGDDLFVSAPGMPRIAVPPDADDAAEPCVVWRDTVPLHPNRAEVDAWFSEFLGFEVHLMHMRASSERVANPEYVPERHLVSLADGYPLLLISEASLGLLNDKLRARAEREVPMERFRPNIVIAGSAPHEEDEWREIRIGDVACNIVKPCERCSVPTVDIATGVPGKEPSRTLATYRKVGSKILFGQNLVHETEGVIHVGDAVLAGAR